MLNEAGYWYSKYSSEEDYFLILSDVSKKNMREDDVTLLLHCQLQML